ncbi:MAG: hypothetical protein BMS9Abin19_0503 [Gammaproteobacteria bacterium]|nr:MAG: hypothetical protein BMS9Abin19_0503 [Gammaproteobacteria bacterium]
MIVFSEAIRAGQFSSMTEKYRQRFLVTRCISRLITLAVLTTVLFACGNNDQTKTKYLERGKAHLAEENYDKARLEFKNVLQIDPKTALPWYFLGQIAEREQAWGRAFGSYTRAIELDKSLIRARARLAQFYLLQANAEKANGNSEGEQTAIAKAKAALDQILMHQPSDPEALSIQASMMARNGDLKSATEQLERVIKESPGHIPAIIMLSKIFEKSRDFTEARMVLENGFKANPDNDKVLFALVQFYTNQKLYAEAVDTMRGLITLKPETYAYRMALASIFLEQGKDEKAEQVLRDAISADAEDEKRYLLLAKFLLENRGQEQAIAELQQFAQNNPELVELQFATAQYFVTAGQINEAVANLHKIIEEYKTSPAGLRARNQLTQIHASLSQFDKARILVDEILNENPKNYDALVMKGRLAFKANNFSDAVTAFRSVLKDQPDAVEILTYLAETHLRLGETELAGEALLRAVDTNPYLIDARIRLARFYLQKREVGLAHKQVDKALDFSPGNLTLLTLKTDIVEAGGNQADIRQAVEALKATKDGRTIGLLRSAKFYLADDQPALALTDIELLLGEQADNINALVVKSEVLTALNDPAALETVLKKIKHIAPEQAGSYYRMGRFYITAQKPEKAITEYEVALTKTSTAEAKSQLLAEIVSIELGQGDFASAKSRLSTVLENDPGHPIAHDLLGAIYMHEKKYSEAETEFEKQLIINPKSDVVYMQLAATHLARNDTSSAISTYERGLVALPDNEKLTLSLAGAYKQQKNSEKAVELNADVIAK